MAFLSRKVALVCAAAFLAAAGTAVQATTLTFDDLGDFTQVPDGYGGVNWDNFYTIKGSYYSSSGYNNGVVSPDYVLFNSAAAPATISGTAFTLNSGYFTAAWNDGLTIAVTGYVDGIASYSTSFVVNTSGPTLETFDWINLSSVTFSSSGGTNAGLDGGGEHFALDNVTVNEAPAAVPEPAAWAMMVGGFGIVGASLRRRQKTSVSFG